MSEEKMMRLSLAARKLNVGLSTITEFLGKKGYEVDSKPNSKISEEQFGMLAKEFASSAQEKEEASSLSIGKKHNSNVVIDSDADNADDRNDDEDKVLIKNAGESKEKPSSEQKKTEEDTSSKKEETKDDVYKSESAKLSGPKVLGKIDLDEHKKGKKQDSPKPADQSKKEEEPVAEKKKAEEAPKGKVEEKEEKKDEAAKPKEGNVEAKKEEAPKAEKPKEEEKTEEKAKAEPKKEEAPKAEKSDEEKKAEKLPLKEEKPADSTIAARADSLKGLTVLGKIDLPKEKERKGKKGVKPVASSDDKKEARRGKRPRKRIAGKPQDSKPGGTPGQSRGPGQQGPNRGGGNDRNRGRKGRVEKAEPTEKEIQEQIKQTMARLSGKTPGASGNRSKYRKEKRQTQADKREDDLQQQEQDSKLLKTTEFISANDLASLMDVSVNDVIAKCMNLGIFASINQRLDAETITIIADEFGFDVKFTEADDETEVIEEQDAPEDLKDRAPIVTIMGHVDHGKTSLLDFIRESKVTAGEAGGITQHIGAYDVMTESGKKVAFLDTPGHEAFTAMRARGAKITDVAIIVIAADDAVMPQTKEAINHAQVAGVPMVIAINKVDKPNSNPDKIKEQLSAINILVEDWGGKYQCQEVSAKTGAGVEDLLEKVLLEAEVLELKANAKKSAVGTVVEAELDKGRGYVTTIMVQAGTLKVGDVLLAGAHYGKVKAMFDHKGQKVSEAGPSTPVLMLGLDGAPQAGDRFNVMDSDREARDIANKREQIQREQSMRTKKHITLDEIGRRLAIGSFKELNVIIKGDVDGSIEALSDSLLKLSTEEIQVNIIHKAVGPISESDVLLASASDAIILGFQVRPSQNARRLADNEEIEIRLYSIIYDAINELKDAMEGMLAPTTEEIITGNIEVREIFKISKIGTVAGCMVTDGYVKRNNKIRLIREGIVKYEGEIDQLKRFKDDVQEVKKGYECGISIKGYNDIKEGDVIEGFEEREVKRTLK
ncbi:translation initiation factor IF-2 [Marivirga harenae]|uniref:translation initiation factor IF-2 n=1 Tax=Marivirga harenae TaxID=2010992 RepID=UPI0026DED64A|nr:translation initiation factor IF-2 [Marivirga harenae]WKV13368.1 translation initiation factor IF-2 [Marivirga harenae]|tara:strand:- start:198292 stop:201288 length:2997 start_codon:yes stop_codon:yes gene_type:complete